MTNPVDGTIASFRGVSKRYGKFLALDSLDLDIQRGEVFGFIGPNGAGKTTTIKVMIGLMEEFSGQLTIEGKQMPAARREVHRYLGYLPQGVAFQDWRTVDQVLTTFGRLSGVEPSELEERIEWALDVVDVREHRHKKVTQLSGGTLQKVGMAQAILHRPPLLVLDEPMSGLDPESRFRFKEIISDLNKEGATVFFSSHILSDVEDVATRIGILSRGRLRWHGTMDELKDHFQYTLDYNVFLSNDCDRWKELEAVPGVVSIEAIGPQILGVHVSRDADADLVAHQLLSGLLERGCRVRSFYPASLSLEQLYVRYVHEDIAGGGAA